MRKRACAGGCGPAEATFIDACMQVAGLSEAVYPIGPTLKPAGSNAFMCVCRGAVFEPLAREVREASGSNYLRKLDAVGLADTLFHLGKWAGARGGGALVFCMGRCIEALMWLSFGQRCRVYWCVPGTNYLCASYCGRHG